MMLRNLFTSSSKVKRGIAFILLLIVVLALINKLFMYNYYQDDQWSRILWHNFYKSENIDNLFLGSSHIYCDVNPNIMDEFTGESNFNLSTPKQQIISSYYLLREALKENDLKRVFLELYYVPSTGILGNYSLDGSIKNMWRTTDYAKLSLNKIQAIWDENGKEHLIDAVLPFIRYRRYLFDYSYMISRHNEKKSNDFLTYNYKEDDEGGVVIFQDKGYYYTDREITNLVYGAERRSDEIFLTEDAEEYLRKIVELCQKENLEITLIVSPIYELQMLSIDTYDNYREKIVEIANEYDINFYDFNLIKEEYLPIEKTEFFRDAGHLNCKGVEMYTNFLCELVYEGKYEGDDLFYSSYDEKVDNMPEQTWGIYTESYTGVFRYHIASTPREGLQYRIVVTPDEGEQYMVQDFAENDTFEINQEGSGIITVVTQFSDGSVSTMEVIYSP
ncbi:MAG: DUF1574 domain-containing protein [Clostridiales bacterium]|nr:DUF1574 domain-containing protein [Clostridiales bacterium]